MVNREVTGPFPRIPSPDSPVPSPESPSPTPAAREYPERPIVGVGAVVTIGSGDRIRVGLDGFEPALGVVLVRRRFPPLAAEWSLPGGAVELGETLETAIAREVAEETGLTIDVGPVIDVCDRIILDDASNVRYHFVLVDYLCAVAGGRLSPGSDVSDAVVADPLALEPYALTELARSMIARGVAMRGS